MAMADELRVVHMASLARSGETLMLRTLAAHPAVHVVHDLHPTNSDAETKLFQLLRVWPLATLPRWQASVAPGVQVLLVKQGVYAMRGPFQGFGLLRNPYAAFSSLWSYDAKLAGETPGAAINLHHWQQRRLPRLIAWADPTLPALVPALLAEQDPVQQFLAFWQARVAQVLRQCRTVVLYEDLVRDAQPVLEQVCRAAGLAFDPALLNAHQRFRPGQRGHGGMDLGQPIRPAPAWSVDPLVELAPFARAVDAGPVPAYRGLYRAVLRAAA